MISVIGFFDLFFWSLQLKAQYLEGSLMRLDEPHPLIPKTNADPTQTTLPFSAKQTGWTKW